MYEQQQYVDLMICLSTRFQILLSLLTTNNFFCSFWGLTDTMQNSKKSTELYDKTYLTLASDCDLNTTMHVTPS